MISIRNILGLMLLITFLGACKGKQNGEGKTEDPTKKMRASSFVITGYIKGAQQGTRFVLTHLGVDKKPDTAVFKGETFEFKGKTPEPFVGEIYTLDAKNNPGAPLKLMIENAFINIEGSIDSFPKSDVIGGLENTDYETLKDIITLYWDSLNVVATHLREASERKDTALVRKEQAEYDSMEIETRNAIKQYAIEHPVSIASAYYVLQYYSSNPNVNELDSIYSSYDSSIHNTFYVKKIKALLDAAKRTSIGQLAPELNLNNENFDTITIASYKGKYLLIDFWASWCLPCRQENPNIVAAYKKYKSKGFDVLGVSLDTDKKQWLNAIRKDHLSWKHVSDFKGMESTVVPLYGIGSIPANFLLDKEGKIIAKDLYGPSLQNKLAEVLK
jgi:peroxiredoxin